MPSFHNVAIIGAGPGGLTLGSLLHLSNIPFTIFEKDPSPHARNQGGSLDLHEDTGLLAVKKANLWNEFQKWVRYDGEAFILADSRYKKWFEGGGATSAEDSTGRPEIDRKRLRQILLESVPAEKIQWGRHLKTVSEDRILTFQDGSTESGFDLLVGADGAWSKIRALVTDVRPYYTGIGGICSQITNAEGKTPDLFKVVNKGTMYSFEGGRGITAQYNGDGSLQVYAWFKHSEDWQQIADKNVNEPPQAKQFLDKEFEQWSPQLKAFYQHADEDDSVVVRNLYMLPVNHRWTHRRGITLLGDAAHLMTLYAGEGVNVAMTDAMVLAEAIIKSAEPDDLDANVRAFEEEMFVRAGQVQELTKANMDDFFSLEPVPVWIGRMAKRMMGQAGSEGFEQGASAEAKELIAKVVTES